MSTNPDHPPDEDRVLAVRDRAQVAIQKVNDDLNAGRIGEAEWYRAVSAELVSAYLAFEDPIWQSGYRGDANAWRAAREIVVDAIDRDGTFLDVGCANGLLMESIVRWAAESGHAIEPYGLDLSPDLAARARLHLPQWSDRIYVGNVIEWEPPRRFDFVRTGVEYVPPARRAELIIRILDRFLLPGGRLIVGPFRSGDPNVDPSVALEQTGHAASGEAESPTPDGTLPRRIIWIDAAAC
jgi:SAM-dependent methyltransferase